MHALVKANVQAHQFRYSAELIREIKSVKSNATDTETSELFCERFGKVNDKINVTNCNLFKIVLVTRWARVSGTLTDGSKRKHFIKYNTCK